MTSKEELLDEELRELLEAEKEIPVPAAGARARVLASTTARISAAAGGSIAASTLLGKGAPLLVAFVLGGAAVAGIQALREPSIRIVYVDRPALASPSNATADARPAAAPDGEPSALGTAVDRLPNAAPSAAARAPAASSASPSGDHLAAERALLDVARTSLASGEAEQALSALSRHQTEFANGLLEEEREALTVKALVMAGRKDEARAKGATFSERFPRSTMRRAVESAVDSIR